MDAGSPSLQETPRAEGRGRGRGRGRGVGRGEDEVEEKELYLGVLLLWMALTVVSLYKYTCCV